jgi:hypothetical protein
MSYLLQSIRSRLPISFDSHIIDDLCPCPHEDGIQYLPFPSDQGVHLELKNWAEGLVQAE